MFSFLFATVKDDGTSFATVPQCMRKDVLIIQVFDVRRTFEEEGLASNLSHRIKMASAPIRSIPRHSDKRTDGSAHVSWDIKVRISL